MEFVEEKEWKYWSEREKEEKITKFPKSMSIDALSQTNWRGKKERKKKKSLFRESKTNTAALLV